MVFTLKKKTQAKLHKINNRTASIMEAVFHVDLMINTRKRRTLIVIAPWSDVYFSVVWNSEGEFIEEENWFIIDINNDSRFP